MSKSFAPLLAGALLLASSAGALASDKAAVEAAIRETFVKTNAGQDPSGAFDENCSVIDEFGPFAWSRCGEWMTAYGTYATQNGTSDAKTQITGFRHVNIANDRAYVVIGVNYTFKENGKMHPEPALEAFTLRHADPGWRIDSFSWFGRNGVDGGADATAIDAVVQDFASLKNAPSSDPQAITDEFPPFAWTGASASADWYATLTKLMADTKGTDLAIKPGAPSELQINGDRAYVAFPAVITSSHNGKPVIEKGSFALALQKTAGVWHIVSWAWATA